MAISISMPIILQKLRQYLEERGFFNPVPPNIIIDALNVVMQRKPKCEGEVLEWEATLDDFTLYVTYMFGEVYFHVWPSDDVSFHFVSRYDPVRRQFLPPEPTIMPIITLGGEDVDAESV